MSLLESAVQNNAQWCDIICSLHGVPGEFTPDLWVNTHKVPTYYPNLITLSEHTNLNAIKDLLDVRQGPWFIKDSFNILNLSSLGFTKLFEARWLLAPKSGETEVKWNVIAEENGLRAWIEAWNLDQSNLFSADLLTRPDINFIALYEGKEIVAGAILNKANGIMGLSNIFCNSDNPILYWKAVVGAAKALSSGLNVITYESDKALEIALAVGFEELGPLSVWSKA